MRRAVHWGLEKDACRQKEFEHVAVTKNVEVQEMRRPILWRALKIFMEPVTAE